MDRVKRIGELVALKATGNPEQFAHNLDISESTLYDFLKVLKGLGAPIEYDQDRCTYFYKENGRLKITFTKEPL